MTVYPDEVPLPVENEKKPRKVAQKPRILGKKQSAQEEINKKVIDKGDSSLYSDLSEKKPKLTPDEEKIVAALENGERLVDDVIAETGLPAGKVLATLTLLEVKGIVKRLPGKRVRL